MAVFSHTDDTAIQRKKQKKRRRKISYLSCIALRCLPFITTEEEEEEKEQKKSYILLKLWGSNMFTSGMPFAFFSTDSNCVCASPNLYVI